MSQERANLLDSPVLGSLRLLLLDLVLVVGILGGTDPLSTFPLYIFVTFYCAPFTYTVRCSSVMNLIGYDGFRGYFYSAQVMVIWSDGGDMSRRYC